MAKKIALLVSAGKIGAYKTKSPSPISIEDLSTGQKLEKVRGRGFDGNNNKSINPS